MKHVLIVDDEKPFLLSVCDGLTGYSDKYQVHLAHNGLEALETLRNQPIDLVVTDLKMPVMDGFQLLVEMNKEFPQIPVIVMTAFGTADIEAQLKQADPFHYLEKPLDLNALSDAINQGLQSTGRSLIRGITLATFLQLVQLEKKTCTLKINAKAGQGCLYLHQGDLIDAETDKLRGEAAVYQIVCWDNPEIEMETICRRKDKIIQSSVEHILLEAYRIEDEKNQELAEEATAQTPQKENSPNNPDTEPLPLNRTMPQAEPAPPGKPTLDTYLRESDAVKSFAIFDAQGFLQRQHDDAAELIKLAPTIFLSAAWLIGSHLDQQFSYLEFRDMDNQRCILCQSENISVAVKLRPGCHPASLTAQLATLDSKTAA